MASNPENDQQQDSLAEQRGEELVEAVREAVDDWVAADDIPARRVEEQIVIDEEELVKNISIMVATAMDKAAE